MCRSVNHSMCYSGVFFEGNVVDAICKVWWRIKENFSVSQKLDEEAE